MIIKIFNTILFIISLPITVPIFLLAMIHSWSTTKDNYVPPRDPESGELLKSFYFGGEWDEDEDALPSDDDSLTAWMFLLADAEDFDPSKDDPGDFFKRANYILWKAFRFEGDGKPEKQSCIPELLWYLDQNPSSAWLRDLLVDRKPELPRGFEDCMKASRKFKPNPNRPLYDWESDASNTIEQMAQTIPSYSHEQIKDLAAQFAGQLKDGKAELTLHSEILEYAEFTKTLSRFEWEGKTMTEKGLAGWGDSQTFAGDQIPTADDYENDVLYRLSSASEYNADYAYGVIHYETTINHEEKTVHVPIDIDEADADYVWTVSEGSMDYDIYEEKITNTRSTEMFKVTVSCNDLEAFFDLIADNSFKSFMDHIFPAID
ncbi:hypothetical protein N8Z80_07625 [Litorivicinus sp.]|nr:hypothetical protein [Litorivicinus sp.]